MRLSAAGTQRTHAADIVSSHRMLLVAVACDGNQEEYEEEGECIYENEGENEGEEERGAGKETPERFVTVSHM